jgi:integrase
LWLGPKGALGDSGIAQMLARRCDLAGVPHINPHRFRHTWAHLFRAEGGAEGDLMYLAGWTSTEMAHRYGRSAAMERAQDAARRIHIGDRV